MSARALLATRAPFLFASITALASLAGCGPVIHGSSVVTGTGGKPNVGAVWLSGIAPPQGAREIGIVQVSGAVSIDLLAPEFIERVAALGGNFGTVEQVSTRFEMVTTMQGYSYSCGNAKAPKTCYGTHPVTVEVATTQMLGHAYVVEGMR